MEAGWKALRTLPRSELHRLSDKQIEVHLEAD
jgi:vacuolar-type H+-ATPase subunit B/Vma2